MHSISELRRRLQVPMRRYNDLGGLFFADWISIYLTWLFLRFGIGPTPATVGMLVLGFAGAALLPFGEGIAVLGGLLVVGFYILDCVDGEVARYQKVEKYIWTFHDFFFGYFVKTAFYIGLAIHAFNTTKSPWALAFGLAAVLGLLFKVFLDQTALFLTARHVFLRTERERKNILQELDSFKATATPAKEPHLPAITWREAVSNYGGLKAIIRGAVLNFHLSVVGFVALAIIDLWLAPLTMIGITFDLKTLFIIFYGILLPLNFLDHLFHYVRTKRFHKDSAGLISAIGMSPDPSSDQ